ncbi:DNA repair protein rad2 [Tulasnella sp. 427]|nr:DNA repair protein rad2 [Tulasnella sp. 427]
MGVKQLWTLLGPVGRPVLLETMEGKVMAIDSSIWIYQFQATMRDKEGRGLVNAHILGFLRRICKLLFYGIKPVFVFDGGAPALKRTTLSERRKKKSGAADTHVRVAERLLAAQLRREALKHVSQVNRRKGKSVGDEESVPIDDSAVYMEDLEAGHAPRTPSKSVSSQADGAGHGGPSNADSTTKESSAEKKRKKWQDHDPYRLPEVDVEAAVAKAASSNMADPRLATEDELQAFIDEMRPEDFDISSEAFRELPTEVQYEIIGDLRLKSRQTSHKRLQTMLRQADTPLDFSKAQIQNLQKRNALTQQLLVTTNMVSRANLTIPIRVASERNREYVLVKNEATGGGWILGIRDEGTQAKPITVDARSDDENDVSGKASKLSTRTARLDPDLGEFRRQMALSSIGKRASPQKGRGRPNAKMPTAKASKPLFLEDVEEVPLHPPSPARHEDLDPALAVAIRESLEEAEAEELRQAIADSKKSSRTQNKAGESSRTPAMNLDTDQLDEEDPFGAPVQREPSVSTSDGDRDAHPFMGKIAAASMLFGLPSMGASVKLQVMPLDDKSEEDPLGSSHVAEDSDDESMEEVVQSSRLPSTTHSHQSLADDSDSDDMEEVVPTLSGGIETEQVTAEVQNQGHKTSTLLESDSDISMEEVQLLPTVSKPVYAPNSPVDNTVQAQPTLVSGVELPPTRSDINFEAERRAARSPSETRVSHQDNRPATVSGEVTVATIHVSGSLNASSQLIQMARGSSSHGVPDPASLLSTVSDHPSSSSPSLAGPTARQTSRTPPSLEPYEDELPAVSTPSPTVEVGLDSLPAPAPDSELFVVPEKVESSRDEVDFDAADEMDLLAEEGDFADLLSQVKGQDLDAARKEVEEEIASLNKERKAAMRDSEDVTQQMVGQIKLLLRLFGIPYVTAPMEAEAQCAALVEFELVDGVITDDSDIFLFGGLRVFRNMFNQSKTVECFLLSDLSRDLGLDRDTLIRLAYLLGSDYVDGLSGVGPVVAMEILEEFPGENGLGAFKEWWTKVQSGKDKDVDNPSKFRQRFKKKFKNLFLPDDWPNPIVRDAYYHPTIDESREAFSWALPDIDGLRTFLSEELGWNRSKVDETLLPIIKRVGQRGRPNAINKQSNLNSFFDITAGTGSYAPKQKQAYASKRLQKVVSDFRKKGKGKESVANTEDEAEGAPLDDVKAPGSNKRKSSTKGKPRNRAVGPKAKGPRKKRRVEEEELEGSGGVSSSRDEDPPEKPPARPRPRTQRVNKPVQYTEEKGGDKSGSYSSGSVYSESRSGKKGVN